MLVFWSILRHSASSAEIGVLSVSMTMRLPEINRYHDRTAPTPLVPVRLDAAGPTIWCKLEFLNPSGSTKDRIATLHPQQGPAPRRDSAGRDGRRGVERLDEHRDGAGLRAARPALRRGDARGRQPGAPADHRVVRRRGGLLAARRGHPRCARWAPSARRADRGGFLPLQFSNPDNPRPPIATRRRRRSSRRSPAAASTRSSAAWGPAARWSGSARDSPTSAATVARLRRPARERPGARRRRVLLVQRPDPRRGRRPLGDLRRFPVRRRWSSSTSPTTRPSRSPARLIRKGFPVGPSSGLNYRAALMAAERLGPEAHIVTVFPDRMERYFSTELFAKS